MSALLNKITEGSIHQEIEAQVAWHGNMSGLSAEKKLRDCKTPYLYLIRAGEFDQGNHKDYYVTYVLENMTIKHQPFTITEANEGWFYENAGLGGPYTQGSIQDVLHLIMHCQKEEIIPLPCVNH